MKFDTQTAAEYAAMKLDSLLERATRDTNEMVQQADLPQTVAYFVELRDLIDGLAEKMTVLRKHIDDLSMSILPTMFENANVKNIKVNGVGTVTIVDRWTCSMLDKQTGIGWLRQTGNEGMVVETVNAMTLGAFAKAEALAGTPLPSDIFKVAATPYVSVRRS